MSVVKNKPLNVWPQTAFDGVNVSTNYRSQQDVGNQGTRMSS